ncbi:LacI family DNA-binding transcriptional regulator [Xylanibacter ruminicola]|uniref:Transcriptional regulator, LacI family n=1 Tax=Xylanibacter ruminicola TaxID=839 RepID=A0A1M6RMR4_XYLRU|nr:LacI family DNA-binding transcriptional regulator [Xylanibacter ruminicola]SHK33729.1 transcriptional regulator, LacI family [Xylanibacter ruminicola]
MKRISQREIANLLGVNVSTVSRALRGLEGVSSELRQQILTLAKEKGYRPNPFAVSLRYDTTRTIGIIVPDISFNHFAHIVKRIEAEARKEGYMCIITDSDDKYETEKNCLELLINMHVEGIIICPSQETVDFTHLQRLRKIHIPVVLFDRDANIDISSVVINDADSARQATRTLIDGGAKRIAFLGGPNRMKQTTERKHGYIEALREKNLPIIKELVKCSYVNYNTGLTDTLDLLDLPEPPDAIIATHGLLVGSAIRAIESRGLRIPEDVSLIGYMSDWVSDVMSPRMSFIKQNQREMGAKAFRLLYDQLNGDTCVQHVIVKARLEIRNSTREIIEG